jgi:nucleoside-diphosphate-sugar epimerase
MRILVVGGSGHVGSITLPYLKEQHDLRVYDLNPPMDSSVEYVAGNVADGPALIAAARGCDALLYMAMGSKSFSTLDGQAGQFDVNVKGVFLALNACREVGISHAVYTSSMSVYHGNLETRDFTDEEMPADAREPYGLSKRFGEEVCRAAWQRWRINVNVLRLCFPLAAPEWEEAHAKGRILAMRADDVARLFLAALEFRAGYQAYFVSGDYEEKYMRMTKAKRLLGWEPQARPSDS